MSLGLLMAPESTDESTISELSTQRVFSGSLVNVARRCFAALRAAEYSGAPGSTSTYGCGSRSAQSPSTQDSGRSGCLRTAGILTIHAPSHCAARQSCPAVSNGMCGYTMFESEYENGVYSLR